MVAAKLANLPLGGNQHSEGTPIGVASQLLNVGERSIQRAKVVLRRGDPALVKQVEVGRVPVSVAEKQCYARESTDHSSETELKRNADDSAVHATQVEPSDEAAGGATTVELADTPSLIPDKDRSDLHAHAPQQEAEDRATDVTPEVNPAMQAGDEDIPTGLDRRPLGSEDQLKFDSVMMAWAKSTELRAALVGAWPVVGERFIVALREYIASASSPAM
jgi:hypothetical protein